MPTKNWTNFGPEAKIVWKTSWSTKIANKSPNHQIFWENDVFLHLHFSHQNVKKDWNFKNFLPTNEFSFSHTKNFTLLPIIDTTTFLSIFVHCKTADFFKSPGSVTRSSTGQTYFLDVNCENWKLRCCKTTWKRNLEIQWMFESFKSTREIMSECSAQCGNYGNLLSHFFDKNFVKVTFLLKKILKSWFDEIFYGWQ